VKLQIIEKYKNKIGLRFNPPLRKGAVRSYVFIHINKTGGTSIAGVTGKPFRKHLTAKEVIDAIGRENWESAYRFSAVRNPWDKMVSHYKHNIKTKPGKMRMPGASGGLIGFRDWLDRTLGPDKDRKFYDRPQHFLPQVEWLKDDRGVIAMDRIIRFEALSAGFAAVAADLGLAPVLPHLNSTEATGFREFYCTESRELVADWFREDISTFGYGFDDGLSATQGARR
jgi:hypothetical protein